MAMNLQKKILAVVHERRGTLTAAKLANKLKKDQRTVKEALWGLEKKGAIRQTTWEEMLHRGK